MKSHGFKYMYSKKEPKKVKSKNVNHIVLNYSISDTRHIRHLYNEPMLIYLLARTLAKYPKKKK